MNGNNPQQENAGKAKETFAEGFRRRMSENTTKIRNINIGQRTHEGSYSASFGSYNISFSHYFIFLSARIRDLSRIE